MEDDLQKKVIEQYVVDAFSFTEAESGMLDEFANGVTRSTPKMVGITDKSVA